MKPAEFRDLLDQMGISQLDVARFLDFDGRQVRRWVSGEAPVPFVVEILLTYMAATNLTPADVLKVCEIDRPLGLV
jgi:transcriptional regulator with XRE-family HTH domain